MKSRCKAPDLAFSLAATRLSAQRISFGPWNMATRLRSRSITTVKASPSQIGPLWNEPGEPENGPHGMELSQRLQSCAAAEDETCRSGPAFPEPGYRSRARVHSRTDGLRSGALPQLRYSNRIHCKALH